MTLKKPNKSETKIMKVVYFDEVSARDYINLVNGGQFDWSSDENKSKLAKIIAEVEAAGGLNLLTLLKARVKGEGEINRETQSLFESKLTNTLLTDYIIAANNDKSIEQFTDVVYAPENSISLYRMYSPYTIIVPKESLPIDLEKLNEALENAKGYYEMLLSNETPPKTVLRLNAKAFRNNYNLADVTKMKLRYYAIKVGTCSIEKLNMEKEFDFSKYTPTAEDILGDSQQGNAPDELNVYDVVLAGVINE